VVFERVVGGEPRPDPAGISTPATHRGATPRAASGRRRTMSATPVQSRRPTRRRRFVIAISVATMAASAFAAEIPLSERRSGYDLMGRDTRAMQDDDTANPRMLSALDGASLWERQNGARGPAC